MPRVVRAMTVLAVALFLVQYGLDGDLALWFTYGAWTLAAAAAVVGSRVAMAGVAEPRRRSGWRLLAAANGLWLTGQIIWDLYALSGATPALPSPADVLWLLYAVVAAVALGRLGAPAVAGRRYQALEAASVAAGVSGIVIALLWDTMLRSGLSVLGIVAAVTYAVVYVGAASVLVQGLPRLGDLDRHRDLLLLLGGFLTQAIAFTWWAPALLTGSYHAGRSLIDLFWVLGLGAIALGGLLAPGGRSVAARSSRETMRGAAVPSLVLLLVVGSLGYATAINDEPEVCAVLLGSAIVMTGLLGIRSWMFAQHVVAAESELSRYLDLAPVMLAVSRRGRLLNVNAAFTHTLGWSERELLDTPVADLVHPDDRARTDEVVRALAERNEPIAVENRYRHKDGGYRWLSWTALPDADRDINYAAARDITDLKVAQAELERSNADLERFAYAASHDLAEPLRTISSFSQLIARDVGPQLDERSTRHLRHVVEAAERMRALIDAMLGYSQVSRRPFRPEPVAVGDIVAGTVSMLDAQLAEAGAVVTWDELPVVMAEPNALAQVLQNLVSNAVKFRGSEPPAVHVAGARENGGWHLRVSDNGIGIEPRHRERIFEMFQRLHSRADYAGTGIGLALCAKVVERHGGNIWVESAPGAGSTFHFTIHDATEDAGEPGA